MTAPDEDDNRFSLQEEISKVFKTSLRRYVPDLPDEEPDIVGCEKKEFGDYYCLNHLTIWNKKRDADEAFKKIHLISKAIKNNLPASASDMMEECEVVGIGYLCFKLSKKWIAKSIHKMLKDGIDTWAPKLPVKKAVVDFSSRNIAEEVDVGHLRSTIIGDTLVRMLEYSKVDVIRRNCLGDQYGMLIDFLFERLFNGEVDDHRAIGEIEVFYKEWKKRFNEDAEFREIAYQAQVWYRGGYENYQNAWAQICEIDRKGYEKVYQRLGVDVEEKIKSMYDLCFLGSLELLRKKGLLEISGGEVVIFVKEKKPMLPKYRERKKIPLTVVKKDGSYDNALTDLADLWYEVNEEKAEWILYVADLGKEDYIEMCIAAARLAGWLPTDEDEYPRTTFVGYGLVEGDDLKRFRTCSTQVVDLLDEAKTRCKAALVEQGKANDWTAEELEHTAEALGYGAVKYADLKKLRFLNFTVNFDEMLNDKGNTGVSLLYTHAQICSIIRKSGKEIEELKKVGKLNLNKDEERELGLQLLQFTQAVEEACTNAVPDILCEYLYKLSEKWTIFFSKCKSIHKMLQDGIDTWAPKLPVKKAVVYFSPRNIPEEVDVHHLRSLIIGDTLVRMLEYSKVDVIRRNRLGDLYGMLIDFLLERLSTEEVNDYLASGEIEFGRFLDYLFERVPNGEVDDHTIGELEVFYKEWKKSFYGSAEFRRRAYQAQVLYQGADERYLNAWAQICEIDRKGYEKVYQRLGVSVEEKSKSSCDFNIPEILDLLRKAEGLIEISRGKQVIFVKEKIWNPILSDFTERKKIPLTVVKKDGSYDYALTDLADLWYEVNEEKAEWIVYVADLGKEDYIEMCIAAARRAGWLPTDEDEYPRTTFVGYRLVEGADLKRFRTCSTQVVDLLDEAKTRCKAALVEQGKADEWTAEELENTAEALGCGAVKYADLKTNRLTNYTFNFDQMLNDKGNTAIYLLYTHARICSIIRKSGKDIEELKKVGELILETDEERELGLHLLRFIEVVSEVCLVLRPHILCEYLYDLSEKFNSLYSSVCEQKVVGSAEDTSIVGSGEDTSIVGSAEETSNLLLCEATAVVMKKCFHLLGITPIYKI